LDLNSRAGGLGGGFKQACGNFSIDIFLTAVGADTRRNAFEDKVAAPLSKVTVALPTLVFPFLQTTHLMLSFSS
jgi:hypothetical protein